MAANVISQHPVAITLRYLQTLTEIGVEKNTTVIFPLPIELMSTLLGKAIGTSAPPAETK